MRLIKTSLLFFLLIVSIDTVSAALQQPMYALAKGLVNNIAASSSTLPAAPTGITTDSQFVTLADSSFNHIDTRYKAAIDRLKQQAAILEKYAKANNYNTAYLFLVDMSLPSGKNRFFVYNFKKNAPEISSLVTHGYGSNKYNNDDPLQFSNEPYSFKTSIGKYKIGNSYSGHFGLAYKLYGLDSTNDKAYERAIVLHSYKDLPDTEIYPARIMESIGCPAVSPSFLAMLDKYLKASKKPILLWIYN